MKSVEEKFHAAARAYFIYGVVYWIGGVYLWLHGIGARGATARGGLGWIVLGAALVVLIPFLLRRPRRWFERWVLSRRDFARILALVMAFRAFKVGEVALRTDGGGVPLPLSGVITFQAGAAVFFVITVAALGFVARAAWSGR